MLSGATSLQRPAAEPDRSAEDEAWQGLHDATLPALLLGEGTPLRSVFLLNFPLREIFTGGAWGLLYPVRCTHYISTHARAGAHSRKHRIKYERVNGVYSVK